MAWTFYDSNGNSLQLTGNHALNSHTGTVDSAEIAAGAIDLAHMSVNSIDSDQYVDGSIDLAHMSADSVDSTQYVDGSIDTAHIAGSQITNALMADNAVDSVEIVAGAIDLAHMSDNSVDSDQYVDASIDLAHMSANSVDSAQYVDGSIDLAHMSANSVDSAQYVDGSIDNVHLADDAVNSDELAAGSVDIAHLSASGSAGSGTFLRGDNSWEAAGGSNSFTNDVTVTSGNFVIATAGKGIDFAAQTASSVASTVSGEVLDHYEEGTFVPHLWDSNKTTNSSVTYNNRLGRYTRIGNIVFFTVSWNPLSLSALTSTSNAYIGGLPFTCSNTNYGTVGGNTSYLRHGLSIGYVASLSMPSGASMIQARIDGGRADIDLQWTSTGSAWNYTHIKVSELGGDWILDVSGHYEVA